MAFFCIGNVMSLYKNLRVARSQKIVFGVISLKKNLIILRVNGCLTKRANSSFTTLIFSLFGARRISRTGSGFIAFVDVKRALLFLSCSEWIKLMCFL